MYSSLFSNVAMSGLQGELNAMKDVIEPLKSMVDKLHHNVDNQMKLADQQGHNKDVIDSMREVSFYKSYRRYFTSKPTLDVCFYIWFILLYFG